MFTLVRQGRLRRSARRLGLAGVTVMVGALSFGVFASSAVASPSGEVAVFAQCPTSSPVVYGCIAIRMESGEVTVGKLRVPIVNTFTLQGGFGEVNEETGQQLFYGANNGETITRAPQSVPGGLPGLVGCSEVEGWGWLERGERQLCQALSGSRAAGLDATIELAAPASSIYLNEALAEFRIGTALALPVKIKLENPLLGNECYIGSDAAPIVMELSTGVSGSLVGKVGPQASRAEGEILVVSASTLVSNTFAAPEASGCGFGGVLDSLINTKVGLPAAAGANTAVLNTTHEQAGSRFVARELGESPSTTPPPPPPPHPWYPWPPRHQQRWDTPHPHPSHPARKHWK